MKTMNNNLTTKAKWLSAVFISLLSLFLLFSLFSFSSFNTSSKHTPHIHNLNHIKLIAASTCQDTRYPELCSSTLSTLPDLYRKSLPEIISEIINIAISEAHASEKNCTDIKTKEKSLHPLDRQSLDICLELLHDIVDEFDEAISYLSSDKSSSKHVHDLNKLFSAARTNLFTCLDGFDDGDKYLRSFIEGGIERIAEHVSNSLALLKKIKKTANNKPQKAAAVVDDGENFPFYGARIKGFPTWLKKEDRALLMAPVDEIKFDLVVAKDGSGDYKTINEALEAAPQLSSRRFVIQIKSGEYYEYVDVNSRYRNIMFVGDGIGKTLIKGNRSMASGWRTFITGTMNATGRGFMARDITVENFAGTLGDQAVAIRVTSDFSAFYKCSFLGYQDTLYVHSFTQYYTHCDIYGTIDFIFGNAAVVFQRCNLYARNPTPKNGNFYTAQGRNDPNEDTGISIIDSKITAAEDLVSAQSRITTYLGRPWRIYSRTVILLSELDDLIHPQGWVEWNHLREGIDTLYYGEYENRGPGSDTSQRVDWPGFRVITNSTEASQFTVRNLIQGDEWLPQTGFPFYPDLIPPLEFTS